MTSYARIVAVAAGLIALTVASCASTSDEIAELRERGEIAELQALAEQGVTVDEPSPIEGVTFRFIETNGIRMRIAEMGDEGPLVLLAHGWPESWYSWRHQLPALARAGYRVVAPDMRGYGETDAPEAVEDYDIEQLADDMVGIIDEIGVEQAVIVGHDWGAIVAWNSVLLHPSRFSGLVAMSVPSGLTATALIQP